MDEDGGEKRRTENMKMMVKKITCLPTTDY